MKQRVTVSIDSTLLQALDRAPGDSRSEKVERLLRAAIAARAYGRWVRELETFYAAGRPREERDEDADWQVLADRAFLGDD